MTKTYHFLEDKSTLRHALDNLETMYEAQLSALSALTRLPLIIAMNIEAMQILAYLQALAIRWRHELPFHENNDVDFREWASIYNRWTVHFNEIEQSGSKEWDRVYSPDRRFRSELSESFDKIYGSIDKEDVALLIDMEETEPFFLDEGKPYVQEMIQHGMGRSARRANSKFLNLDSERIIDDLTRTLRKSYDLFCSLDTLQHLEVDKPKYDEACSRLFHRQAERYCMAEIKQARYEAREFISTLDASNILPELEFAIRLKSEEIAKDPACEGLSRHIDFRRRILSQTPAIGRFLFTNRRHLTDEQMRQLIYRLLLIDYYQEHEEELKGKKTAEPQHLTKEQKKLLDEHKLHDDFNRGLRENPTATLEFIRVMKQLYPLASGKTPLSDRFNWLQVKDALESLRLLPSTISDKRFCEIMFKLFPNGIKAGSYLKSINRAKECKFHQEVEELDRHRQKVQRICEMLKSVCNILNLANARYK